jgi:DNA-directed RNA polymerase specialized sigma subunit
MNAKEYLSQALWLDQMILSKLEQLETLKSLSMKVTSSFAEEKVSGGNVEKSKMESTIVKVIDLEGEINADFVRLIELKKEIQDTINRMEDINYQLLLEMRYLNGKNWEEIAQELKYNNRTVFKVHGKALKQFERVRSIGQ